MYVEHRTPVGEEMTSTLRGYALILAAFGISSARRPISHRNKERRLPVIILMMCTTDVWFISMVRRRDPDVDRLQHELIGFIRAFGLLSGEQTPCGQAMAPSDAHALAEIAAGPLSQRDLVDRLRLDRSSVSRLVDRLVARGWVERSTGADDRRTVRLTLTAAGRKAATQLAEAREQRFAMLLDAVPADHKDTVLDALKLLTDAARTTDGGNP